MRSGADGLEWIYGGAHAALQLRFDRDFAATVLRPSEFVSAKLGDIEIDTRGELWLRAICLQGEDPDGVVLPLMACTVPDRYLAQRDSAT